MHVLLVIPTLEPGGAERMVVQLARGLPQYGVKTTVCYLDGRGTLSPQITEAGVEAIGLQLPHKAYPAFARLGSVLRRVRPNLIHAHMPRAAVWAACARRLVRYPPPLIYTEHTLQELYPRWSGVLFGYFLPRADHVICVSEAARKDLIAWRGGRPLRTSVIWNGVDLPNAAPSRTRSQVRQELGTPESALVLCSVGSLTHRKGHDVLLRALADVAVSCPELICWIAGSADLEPDYARRVAALTEELRLAGRVRLLGHREDVPDLLAACDFFALASRYEGFGLVLAEAMAVGKAVVATQVGACEEVVAHGKTGLLVPPEDAHALAEAILCLSSDPQRSQEMGDAGRRRVHEHFTIEATVKRHVTLYEEVAGATPGGNSRRPPL